MKIHEYQAKLIFKDFGISVPRGRVAFTPRDAVTAARELGEPPYVLKAQVHSGGRGKAGGIKVVGHLVAVEEEAAGLLGKILITSQTGTAGRMVSCLLVEEKVAAEKEFYLAVTIDRTNGCALFLASNVGGMEIERTAVLHPQEVIREAINPAVGMRPFQGTRVAYALGLTDPKSVRALSGLILNLDRLFSVKDCLLAEINPLVITGNGEFMALDGKVTLDDNALFRHPDLTAMRDETQEDPLEVEASRYSLNYIKLKGNVGCVVNGAGLAMATMDLIKHAGGEPANFLDVGGNATEERVKQAFRLLFSDPHVEVVLVNVFGGILRCDVLASGMVSAMKDIPSVVPVVVRLEGTNVEEGRRILGESGLDFIRAADMKDAASKVMEALDRVGRTGPGR